MAGFRSRHFFGTQISQISQINHYEVPLKILGTSLRADKTSYNNINGKKWRLVYNFFSFPQMSEERNSVIVVVLRSLPQVTSIMLIQKHQFHQFAFAYIWDDNGLRR